MWLLVSMVADNLSDQLADADDVVGPNGLSPSYSLSLWFKLLFIPSAALLVLSILFIQDHIKRTTFRDRHIRTHIGARQEQQQQQSIGTTTERLIQFFKRTPISATHTFGITTQSHHEASYNQQHTTTPSSPSPSSSPIASSSDSPMNVYPIRLVLLNNEGVSHCYRVNPILPLAEIANFYLSKLADNHKQSDKEIEKVKDTNTAMMTITTISSSSNSSSSSTSSSSSLPPLSSLSSTSVVLRYQGRKLPMDESPHQLDLPDMAVIEVEPDYLSLFNTIRVAGDAIRCQAERELRIERRAKQLASDAIIESENRCREAEHNIKEMKEKMEQFHKDKIRINADIERMKQEIQQQQEARARSGSSASSADSDANELRAARLQLEHKLSTHNSSLSSLTLDLDTLKQQHAQLLKERQDNRDKYKDMMSQLEVNEKEMNIWKQRAMRMQQNKEKIDKVEKMMADAQQYKQRMLENDQERIRLDKEIVEMKEKTIIKEDKEKELNHIKQRIKSMEKELKDMNKYKGQVKILEKEAKEAQRWKGLVKQGKLREKNLEKDMKELHHWRQRARAFEKEVKELRGWKRIITEQARDIGREHIIPEFPLEGNVNLDSSGSNDLLSSGGSGIGDLSSNNSSGHISLSSTSSATATNTTNAINTPISSSPSVHSASSPLSEFINPPMDPSRFSDLIRAAYHHNHPSMQMAEYTEFDFDAETGITNNYHQQQPLDQQYDPADYDLYPPVDAGDDDDDIDFVSFMPDTVDVDQGGYSAYSTYTSGSSSSQPQYTKNTNMNHAQPYGSPITMTMMADNTDDNNELMHAGRSDKLIKAALLTARSQSSSSSSSMITNSNDILPSLPPIISTTTTNQNNYYPSTMFNSSILPINHSEQELQYNNTSNNMNMPVHNTNSNNSNNNNNSSNGMNNNSTPFFSTWPAPVSVTSSPLLIIDDRQEKW